MTYTYSSDDLLQLFQNLCPEGIAFPRDPDSVQTALFSALADAESYTTERASYLLEDAFPPTSVELLPEWEATCGLPDPCLGPSPTLIARQRSLVARLLADGGQSIPYLKNFCSMLGYPNTTFNEFAPFRFGTTMGRPMCSDDWTYALGITGIAFAIHPFLFGHDTTGEAFATWDNSSFICEVKRIAPAHVYLEFVFAVLVTGDVSNAGHAQATTDSMLIAMPQVSENGSAFDLALVTSVGTSAQQVQEKVVSSISTNATATRPGTVTVAGSARTSQNWTDAGVVASGSASSSQSATAIFRPVRNEALAAVTTITGGILGNIVTVVETGVAAATTSATKTTNVSVSASGTAASAQNWSDARVVATGTAGMSASATATYHLSVTAVGGATSTASILSTSYAVTVNAGTGSAADSATVLDDSIYVVDSSGNFVLDSNGNKLIK